MNKVRQPVCCHQLADLVHAFSGYEYWLSLLRSNATIQSPCVAA